MIKNILLCGVGGQGVLLAAKLMAYAASNAGYRVFTNEIHGMAQRGGSVTASVRFGDTVSAPLFAEGETDLLFAMEHAEALRNAHCLKPDGNAVIARASVIPVTVTSGAAKYPADMEDRIAKVFPRAVYLDCAEAAKRLGNAKLANTYLLGAASRFLQEIDTVSWRNAMHTLMKPELVEMNFNAFNEGRNTK